MNLVPEHRALLAVDVVGAGRAPGHQKHAVGETVKRLVMMALIDSGIDPALVESWESQGDGALLTLPASALGALVDLGSRLDEQAWLHNRRAKPETRFRIAVETGPVGTDQGFYTPKVSLCRMLEAKAFKDLFAKCRKRNDDELINSAMIISGHVRDVVFGGDYARLVRRGEFAPVEVRNKEHASTAWVRVPGVDVDTLRGLCGAQAERPEAVEPPDPPMTIETHNSAGQVNRGVQAGSVRGDINIGGTRR